MARVSGVLRVVEVTERVAPWKAGKQPTFRLKRIGTGQVLSSTRTAAALRPLPSDYDAD
jgi:hypothetical protein